MSGAISKQEVQWDRKAPTGAKDGLGRRQTASVAGFPVTVRGNYQENARRAKIKLGGADVAYEGDLYSETHVDGNVGDLVTVNGKTLYVVSVGRRTKRGSGAIKFARYFLATEMPGGQQG